MKITKMGVGVSAMGSYRFYASILDREYCNKCGHYYNIDLNTGDKLSCECKCHPILDGVKRKH